jgi:hypothetical protein
LLGAAELAGLGLGRLFALLHHALLFTDPV